MAAEQDTMKPRKLLRAVNAELYEMFTERLEEHRIHSYDVQLVVEKNDDDESTDLVLKVLYGDGFDQVFEKPVSQADLNVDSPEMETFLSGLIAACEEGLVLDYRKFMQPHT